MQHDKAAVSRHGVDLLVPNGQLDAQGTRDFITHARIAVLHIVGVGRHGAPHALHAAGQAAGGADHDGVFLDQVVDGRQHLYLGKGGVEVLCEALGRGGVRVLHDGLIVIAREAVVFQQLPLGLPLAPGFFDLITPFTPVAGQRLLQGGQGRLGVGQHGHRVHFLRLEGRDADVDEARVLAEQPLGGGGEVCIAGADADDQVGLLGQAVRGRRAGHADTARVERVIPHDGAFARLGLPEGNPEGFREGAELFMCLGIAHAAAADQQGALRGTDGRRRFFNGLFHGRPGVDHMDTLFKEAQGIIIGLALHILRQRHTDGARIGGVGQHAHGVEHRAHQLLGAVDPVPVAADGAEGIVGGQAHVMRLLDLLQHRVRLAARVDIARQQEHGDVVGRGGRRRGDHVGGAGADRAGHGEDLLSLHLL